MRNTLFAGILIAAVASPLVALETGNLSLTQIQQIAKSGTPGLAVELLDERHPGIEKGVDEWFRWTKVRTSILAGWKQWERAISYLENAPESLPDSLQRWVVSQQAWLQLERGEPELARQLLRQLIWVDGGRHSEQVEGALWRRLIIRSYLLEDRIEDAATSLHRYQQDYASNQPQWLDLRARVLLRQQKQEVLLDWPQETFSAINEALRLLAELRGGMRTPTDVMASAQGGLDNPESSNADRSRYWFLLAAAADVLGDPVTAVVASEQALLTASALPASDKLFRVHAADLWSRYYEFGLTLANRQHLLIGDDVAWFSAVQLASVENPLQAKALLAVLSERATSDSRREQALTQIAELIAGEENGLLLVTRLFSDQSRFVSPLYIPLPVRHQMVEYALSVSDVVTASDLLATMPAQAGKAERFEWNLRRARVMVMGGRAEQGSTVLDALLTEQLFISPEQLDKFMQVLFDLQSSENHRLALALFSRLETERQLDPQQRRELFFWMGESFSATRQYAQAALYYMRSATYTDPTGADLWGQSARYSAAEALTKAGLVSDARRVYESLLRITEDPSRRAVLRGRLQKLLVLPSGDGDV